jgi:hypothetical protein
LDGVSGDQVDQEENERDYEPDDRKGVEDALEEGLQGGGPLFVILSAASAKALAESKDPFQLRAILLLKEILCAATELGSTRERLDASGEITARVGVLRLRATGRFARGRASLRMTDL